jgi:uncharacterized membrane protein HdeD (DUF308 family)
VTPAPLLETPLKARDLAAKLWRISLLRGLVALALGAYVFSRPIGSPATIARVVAVYWIVDGLVALWASLFAATLAANRVFLVVRGISGIGAALLLLVLPLGEIFGPWQPGQIMLLILTMAPALAAISLQIVMTAAIDLLIGLEVRRRIPGEWSLALGAVLSIAFSALVVAGFFGPPTVLWRLLGVVGLVGGLSLVVGAFRLKRTL